MIFLYFIFALEYFYIALFRSKILFTKPMMAVSDSFKSVPDVLYVHEQLYCTINHVLFSQKTLISIITLRQKLAYDLSMAI